MQKPVQYLRWSLLQKYLVTFNHELFLQKGSECVSEFSGVLGANFWTSKYFSYIMHGGGYLYCRVFFTLFLDNISGLSGSG